MKKSYHKVFFVITGACFLVLLSRQAYQRRYGLVIARGNEAIQQNNAKSRHLSTGTISETLGSGKYLYTVDTKDYLLYTTKSYIPGNQIRLVARNSVQSTNPPPLTQISRENIFYSGFNAPKRSKMKGYSNILYETNSILIETGTIKGFPKIRHNFQKKLHQTYSNDRTAGLVLGMLIGDKSKFTKSEYQLFIDSGLVHLVAVSGGNIVMLVAFLTAILFFVPFYARITLILLAVLSYGIICGMDSSVLRAVLMGSLSLFALLVGRGTSLRRLLGLVHIGMLIYNPYFLVYDVGYLLSFSAVLGIIFIDVFKKDPKVKTQDSDPSFATKSEGQIQLKKNIIRRLCHSRFVSWCGNLIHRIRSNYLKPSLGATLGIFPVIIFFMGQINIGGVVGNMFVLPLVPFIMIGGFIGAFLPSRLQTYYIPIVDFLVERNYIIAAKIDQYGPTIIADAPWIKFLLFSSSVIMMILVIRTLTQHEADKTTSDKQKDGLDKTSSTPYDDILGTLPVEVSQK
ncbi:MAG: ComEC/Rec2 family competence protein [Candidatus Absconditabacteria bacterium]|nr:ComEC/Rec2 family competence protein [Candidatus Absconditabacteria bacterium]